MTYSKEKRAEYNRRYREKNKDRARKYGREWRAANREHVSEYNAQYRQTLTPEKRSEYYQNYKVGNPDKIRSDQLLFKYGITLAERDAMLAAQGGCCAICGGTETGSVRDWHVDHCHKTQEVRGILCHPCNVGLGLFRDDPIRLLSATAYLEKHSQNGDQEAL